MLTAVTDATFERDVLRSGIPVLVDFWARWCPPCHMIAPVLAEIARDRAGDLAVLKLDTDENPLTARTYQVMSLPTLILFDAGEPLTALVGARPKLKLVSEVESALRGRLTRH
ncbi:thioredoxin [Actinokineospora sp. UTMC 2448]|uniref:thioredoxin n=1 Tax=Actinokineospora sp. UTMC 2448 TaxID=2268449 RepID=UPI0021641602|nr:thioredoxin [Actinokineospora sp. UTMC 2448]UVS82673.1 Thioredoxin [Actinokineospora sp. UTMC 2448]